MALRVFGARGVSFIGGCSSYSLIQFSDPAASEVLF